MTKPDVFATRFFPGEGFDLLRSETNLQIWQEELPPPYALLLEKAPELDGLLCMVTDRISSELIQAGGRLKVISQMAVGIDNIDLAAATAAGIPVGNTPGVLTETTADFAWALLMASARRLAEGDRYTREGKWKTWTPTLLLGSDIHGATIGVVGMGRIGQAVARRAFGFGMRIFYVDTQDQPEVEHTFGARRTSLDDLLRQADFVTLHTSLNSQTRNLMGKQQFQLMKPGAVLINTARGQIVDQAALYQALKNGEIAYAALDVTDPEPLPPDDPLLTLDQVIITPHIASASIQTRARMAHMAAENLLAGLRGERLPYCANPEVYR